MKKNFLKKNGISYYSSAQVSLMLEKIAHQLTTNNKEAVQTILSHYLEKIKTGEEGAI